MLMCIVVTRRLGDGGVESEGQTMKRVRGWVEGLQGDS